MVREVLLGRGPLVALVDDEDYERVSGYKWHAMKRDHGHSAIRSEKGKIILMHRFILNPPAGMVVDHINHDGLDNTRANIRICTQSQNSMNRLKHKHSDLSIFKGVSSRNALLVSEGKITWQASISIDGKVKGLGTYRTEIEAARAYNEAALVVHGEFACLNKLDEETIHYAQKTLQDRINKYSCGDRHVRKPSRPYVNKRILSAVKRMLSSCPPPTFRECAIEPEPDEKRYSVAIKMSRTHQQANEYYHRWSEPTWSRT